MKEATKLFQEIEYAVLLKSLGRENGELLACKEQMARLGDDCERYRWLRDMVVLGREDDAITALNDACSDPDTAEKFDAAIDAARAALKVEPPMTKPNRGCAFNCEWPTKCCALGALS